MFIPFLAIWVLFGIIIGEATYDGSAGFFGGLACATILGFVWSKLAKKFNL